MMKPPHPEDQDGLQAMVPWVLNYDWQRDPLDLYSRPQDLAGIWPLVRVFFMSRYGAQAFHLHSLISFLHFLKTRTVESPDHDLQRSSSPLLL